MNLVKWNEVYENNKRLDKIFIEKYSSDSKLFEKNIIELIIEIGEFVQETRVFKYWSNKKPNKEKMLEEYADVITMILTFYNELNLEIKPLNYEIKEKDLLLLIKKIYSLALELADSFNESVLEKLFCYILYIGQILNFNENEVLDAINNKQKIIAFRLNSDY